MCEPNGSIVQYPDQDDGGTPTGTLIDAIPQSEGKGAWKWFKRKIGSWFHLSVPGYGHSEAISLKLAPMARNRLPQDTKYEVQWWVRQVTRDGWYSGIDHAKEEALEAATIYAKQSAIGNLTQLRQFLEATLKRTDRPAQYLDPFYQMLNKRGKDELSKKLKLIPTSYKSQYNGIVNSSWNVRNLLTRVEIGADNLDRVIKTLLGFTRRRDLLVPEWADDSGLWSNAPKLILG